MNLISSHKPSTEPTPFWVMLALIVTDVFTIALSMYCGYKFYHLIDIGVGPQPLDLYLKLTIGAEIVMIVIFQLVGLYEPELSILNISEVRKIFKATIIGLLVFFFLTFYMKNISFSRLIITFSATFLFILMSIQRLIFYKMHQKLHARGLGVKRVIIFGAGEVGRLLLKRLMQSPALGYLPVGFLDDDPEKYGKLIESDKSANACTLPVIGNFSEFPKFVQKLKIDEIFVTITSLQTDKFAQVIHYCRELGVDFRFVPNLFDLKIQKISVSGIDGIPLLSIKAPHIDPLYSFFKRAFDIFLSTMVMLFFFPLFSIVAILIKNDSKGPVFFKQKRVGLRGKEFTMYKFRTMWTDAKPYEWTPKTLDDSRITKFGKFLRRTSLDELPQCINVLKGDMSIVGPRPEMPFIVDTYNEISKDRLHVKPGITGLWQISADRGKQIHDNIEYDLYYLENAGFLMDMVIIIRTLYFALRGIGAF